MLPLIQGGAAVRRLPSTAPSEGNPLATARDQQLGDPDAAANVEKTQGKIRGLISRRARSGRALVRDERRRGRRLPAVLHCVGRRRRCAGGRVAFVLRALKPPVLMQAVNIGRSEHALG